MNDIIAAIATPIGQGAIGVVRISGPDCISVLSSRFSNKQLLRSNGHTLHLSNFIDAQGRIIDEVLVSVFRAPRSYTKEESLEISCHGSPLILKRILSSCNELGIRLAEKGEFTQRAFLNGQLDLTQAEAVAELISAPNLASLEASINNLKGGFKKKISELREQFINLASLLELELDFSEEDIEFADRSQLKALIAQLYSEINKLVIDFKNGNVLKQGIPIAIVGPPNAGKSTLLNALLNDDRAIVSDIAGTTRDTIEEKITVQGVELRFIDTAGIRNSDDTIEKIGIERSQKAISQAEIVMLVIDASQKNESKNIEKFLDHKRKETALIVVKNKVDISVNQEQSLITHSDIDNNISISALNGKNLDLLLNQIMELIEARFQINESTLVINQRHYDCVIRIQKSLDSLSVGLDSGLTNDLLAVDAKQVLHDLGVLTGEIHTDDLLENIFSNFCIGK